MKCIILANGEYGKMDAYINVFKNTDMILCADGGANYAYQLGVKPSCIIGDMDSIRPEVREQFRADEVPLKKYPKRKDFTDTQLALATAEEAGADEIILLGTLGKRLDHTLANLYCGIEMAQKGKRIIHYSPDCKVYLLTKELDIIGNKGDTVSALVLSEQARGVYEIGFEYALVNATLENSNPIAVSNVLAGERGRIMLKEGVLAVFHYYQGEG